MTATRRSIWALRYTIARARIRASTRTRTRARIRAKDSEIKTYNKVANLWLQTWQKILRLNLSYCYLCTIGLVNVTGINITFATTISLINAIIFLLRSFYPEGTCILFKTLTDVQSPLRPRGQSDLGYIQKPRYPTRSLREIIWFQHSGKF